MADPELSLRMSPAGVDPIRPGTGLPSGGPVPVEQELQTQANASRLGEYRRKVVEPYRAYAHAFMQSGAIPEDATPDEVSQAMEYYSKSKGDDEATAQLHASRAREAYTHFQSRADFANIDPERETEKARRGVAGETLAPVIGTLRDFGSGAGFGTARAVTGLASLAGVDSPDAYIRKEEAENIAASSGQAGMPYAREAGGFVPYVVASKFGGAPGMGVAMAGQGASTANELDMSYLDKLGYAGTMGVTGAVLPSVLGAGTAGAVAPVMAAGTARGGVSALATDIAGKAVTGGAGGLGLGMSNVLSADAYNVPRGETFAELANPTLLMGAIGGAGAGARKLLGAPGEAAALRRSQAFEAGEAEKQAADAAQRRKEVALRIGQDQFNRNVLNAETQRAQQVAEQGVELENAKRQLEASAGIGQDQFNRNVLNAETQRAQQVAEQGVELENAKRQLEASAGIGRDRFNRNVLDAESAEQSKAAADAQDLAQMGRTTVANEARATKTAVARADLALEQMAAQTGGKATDLQVELRDRALTYRQESRGAITAKESFERALADMLPQKLEQMPVEGQLGPQTAADRGRDPSKFSIIDPQNAPSRLDLSPDVAPGEPLVRKGPPLDTERMPSPQPGAPAVGAAENRPLGEPGPDVYASHKQEVAHINEMERAGRVPPDVARQMRQDAREHYAETTKSTPVPEGTPNAIPPSSQVRQESLAPADEGRSGRNAGVGAGNRPIRLGEGSRSSGEEGQRQVAPRAGQEEIQGQDQGRGAPQSVEGGRDQVSQPGLIPAVEAEAPDIPRRRNNARRGAAALPSAAEVERAVVDSAKYVYAKVGAGARHIVPTLDKVARAAMSPIADAIDRLEKVSPLLSQKLYDAGQHATKLVTSSAADIGKALDDAALDFSRSKGFHASTAVKAPASGTGLVDSPFYAAVEGRAKLDSIPASIRPMVEAMWRVNRFTADWFREAGLTKASGADFRSFRDGVGMVRMMHKEIRWVLDGHYGKRARDTFYRLLADANPGETFDSVQEFFQPTIKGEGSQATVKRDALELSRRFKVMPSDFFLDGKRFRVIDLDPNKYVTSLVNGTSARVGFAKSFGQEYDPTSSLRAQGVDVLDKDTVSVANIFRRFHGLDVPFMAGKFDSPAMDTAGRWADVVKSGLRGLALQKSGVGTIVDMAGWSARAGTGYGTTRGKDVLAATVRMLWDTLTGTRAEGRQALTDAGVLPDHAMNWLSPQGVPESISNIFRVATGKAGLWHFQYIHAAHSGLAYAEALKSGEATGAKESVRLRSIGFSEADAKALSSGANGGTDAQYADVVRRVASYATGETLRPEQQGLLDQYSFIRRNGPAFTSYMNQQHREFMRQVRGVRNAKTAEEVYHNAGLFAAKMLGTGISGTATVLAYSFLAGAARGEGAAVVAQEVEDRKHFIMDSLWRSWIGGHLGTAVDIIAQATGFRGKPKDIPKTLSFTGAQMWDLGAAGVESATVGGLSPYLDFLQRKTVILSSGLEQDPSRRKAVASFYRFADENPEMARMFSGGGSPNAVSIAIKRAVQAAKNKDPAALGQYLVSAFKEAKLIGRDEPNISAAFRSRMLLPRTKGFADGTYEGLTALRKSIGVTAIRELAKQDEFLELMADSFK